MKTLFVLLLALIAGNARAQDIPSVIAGAISTVTRAVDLQIQRFQTQTIGLQEAQKELENIMAATELDDIRVWVEQQRDLYAEYFTELLQVKAVVSGYHRVKEAVARQEAILQLYQQALARFRQDRHFSPSELAHIEAVLAGLLKQSEQNLTQLMKAIGAAAFQMTDQQRLSLIGASADGVDSNYTQLQRFTQQTQLLSLQRAQDETDYFTLLKLYGL